MKQRKRSTIRKAREAIKSEAERLQRAGVHVERKVAKIGGRAPESVAKLMEKEDPK